MSQTQICFGNRPILHAGMSLVPTPYVYTTALADTYYKVEGFAGNSLVGFSYADNSLTLKKAGCYALVGVSDLQVDRTCSTVYGLGVDGVVIPEATTQHTFTSPAKTGTIAITKLVDLYDGQVLTVWIKSDAVDTQFTIHTLNLTLVWVGPL